MDRNECGVVALAEQLDEAHLRSLEKIETSELIAKLSVLAAGIADRGKRVMDLTEVAITQLPDSTDADKPLVVLEALLDRLRLDGKEEFEMIHMVAALINRVQAKESRHGHSMKCLLRLHRSRALPQVRRIVRRCRVLKPAVHCQRSRAAIFDQDTAGPNLRAGSL